MKIFLARLARNGGSAGCWLPSAAGSIESMVNRIGADVPGMPKLLRWISPVIPLVAGRWGDQPFLARAVTIVGLADKDSLKKMLDKHVA